MQVKALRKWVLKVTDEGAVPNLQEFTPEVMKNLQREIARGSSTSKCGDGGSGAESRDKVRKFNRQNIG